MSIVRKVKAVERVFHELAAHTQQFHQATGLECKAGCSACCRKPDVEATPLEMLPFAFNALLDGQAEGWYDRLTQRTDDPVCALFNPFSLRGGCTQYTHRGLICRLFGSAAMLDKYGQPQLVACKVMKEELTDDHDRATQWIADGGDVPIMRHYYFRMIAIDAQMSEKRYPINEAMRRALEAVLVYYQYRRPPRRSTPRQAS